MKSKKPIPVNELATSVLGEINKRAKGEKNKNSYRSYLLKNPLPYNNRLCIGIPMTGLLRAEWVMARYGQVIPTNWSNLDIIQWIDTYAPTGFMVADARNMVVKNAVEKNMEWLLFIDHDVILPPDAFLRFNDYIRSGEYPIVSGVYFTRSSPSEPLVYRGRGNSYFDKWKVGDKVMVDGTHMGCTLINMKIIKAMWDNSEEYFVGPNSTRRVFHTPNELFFDENTGNTGSLSGTEDLFWCDRVKNEGYYEKCGFGKFQKMQFPILCDTGISCYHMDISGQRFPENADLLALRRENKNPKFIK